MASAEQQQKFLDEVVPICTKYAKEFGVPQVSFLIAQCCFESGWGTSGPAKNLHNILGIGPGKNFDSWDSCVKAYFTSTVLGQKPELKTATTFDQYWNLFVDSGYCDENQADYKSSLQSIISMKNLTQYDNGTVVPASGVTSGTSATGTAGTGAATGTNSIAGMTFDTSLRERETARTEEGDHPELKTFYRINMTGAQFIKQVLAPYCKSKETGQGGYRLWFDDETAPDGAPGVKINFKPDQYSNIEDKMGDRLLPDVDRTYEFSYGTGPISSVIEFNPNYAGIVTSVIGGYEVEAATTDAITNDLFSLKYNRFTDPNRPSTGDSVFDDLQGSVRIGASSYSYDEVASRAANLWYNMASYGYTAEMTVLGDPMIDVQKLCAVAVYTPQGLPHYSSGVYLITQVTDSISGGIFTSTMNLIRNAISIGTNDSGGVDITVGATETRYIGDAAAAMMGTTTPSTGTSATSGTGGSTDLRQPLTQGQSVSLPAGLGTYYTITGYGGRGIVYSDGETRTWASGTNQREVWNKWVAAGRTYTDHIATINGKWLIACTSTYGKVGDYITFTLGNGQILECIMADEKNQSDKGCTQWGHDGGQCVIEFEVDMDYYHQVGNPGNSKWKPEWSGTTVVSATNYGPAI